MSRNSKPLNLVTLLLLFSSGLSFLPISLPGIVQPVQAQTNETQQTEAERLLKLCREHLSQNQTEFLQQALTVAQEIKDTELEKGIRQILAEAEQKPASPQQTEADRLLELGIQQFQTSQYPAAIASWQKALDLYRDIGAAEGTRSARNGEANSLNNLGNAYNFYSANPR